MLLWLLIEADARRFELNTFAHRLGWIALFMPSIISHDPVQL
jgi:hypothetical protein